jgi:hypothetical protein
MASLRSHPEAVAGLRMHLGRVGSKRAGGSNTLAGSALLAIFVRGQAVISSVRIP